MKNVQTKQKYTFNNIKIYVGLLLFFIILYALKLSHVSLPDIISQHVSNFSITGGLFLLSSDSLLRRLAFTKLRLLLELLPFALLNVIIELFVHVDVINLGGVSFVNFNTPDPVDMAFGFAALAGIYFVLIRYSVKVANKKDFRRNL